MLDQALLHAEAPGIASQTSIAANQTVTGNDNCDGIAPVGSANSPRRCRISEMLCQFLIGRCCAVWNLLQGLPDALLERGADRSEWEAFRTEYRRIHRDLLDEHNAFRRSVGADPCPPDEFNTHSPWLNLYLYPEAADYDRAEPLDPTWHRLQSTVRTGEASFDVDEHVPGDGKLIYLSLGSLGCMDVGLMQRLIDVLAGTEHRTIVSMGPLKEKMTLGPRMYGDQFLPQPSILPQCDLLITHGGNNTTCEGFHFGLPMIALPLFWDQYDNAQRLEETGFGRRLPTYDWTPDRLTSAIDSLLGDRALTERMQANAEGGLSERALKRAMELANDADLRVTAPRKPKVSVDAPERTVVVKTGIRPNRQLLPGTQLKREYKGGTVRVTVLADGFEFEGERYKSLTAIAKAVTGTHWNGHHFFGLRQTGGDR